MATRFRLVVPILVVALLGAACGQKSGVAGSETGMSGAPSVPVAVPFLVGGASGALGDVGAPG